MNGKIGNMVMQTEGYEALVLATFPSNSLLKIPVDIQIKSSKAQLLIGKLDGITHTLPDANYFIKMFKAKDATSSSQIEGTRASIEDALEMISGINSSESDADDIIFYLKALEYGINMLESLPLSQRLICEVHDKLMSGARSTQFSDPGKLRKSQNWIGGAKPSDALFVPPPAHTLSKAMGDLEKFINSESTMLELVQLALIHAQFEAIHPFLDGNGRVGRLLITLFLHSRKLLERPVLFLSSYFKKYQDEYYTKLNGYHNGRVEEWVHFFLDAVIETATQSVEIPKKIRELRDEDMSKLLALSKRDSESGVKVLTRLFSEPIVTVKSVESWTGFTRQGAGKVVDRFVDLDILETQNQEKDYDRKYGQKYKYRRYSDLFM